MVVRDELVEYLAGLLGIDQFDDYAPNGLQVEGCGEVNHIVGGVTASQALIDAAVEREADALLVHHGFFWRGEKPSVVGMKRRRIQALLDVGINLLAYHLPLDAHKELGNNVQLGQRLGLKVLGSYGQPVPLALYGELEQPLSSDEFCQQIAIVLKRHPLHITTHARAISKVAWCTGAAQSYFESAATVEVDAFITGEISAQCTHIARELGIDFFGAGHHATERYGVMALGEHLSQQFGLTFEFVDIDNPV